MSDLWWWLGLGGSATLGILSWWAPEWLIWKRNQRKQAVWDQKWANLPHIELECPECRIIWCDSCFGDNIRHEPTCSASQPPVRR